LQKGDKKDFIFDILLKLYEKLVAEKNTLVITASSNLFVGGGAGSITAFWEETEVIKYKTTEETTLPYVDNVDTGTESYISPRIQNNVVVGVTNDTKTQYKRVLVKPSNGALGATPPKNISLSNLGRFQIAINYQLKSYGLAETFAHEFYSHLWLKLQGLPFAHFEASTEKRIESVLAHEKKILKQVYENYNKK
jgi:hypothetical protein